jgi:D-alanyl-lipoteichoic acid acyltransferase DltB (MBOAT superfamily)
MTFIDSHYLFIFLPLVLTLYYFARKSPLANVIVLCASYYFYGSSGVFLLIPLLISSLVDFYVGHKLDESTNEPWRKFLLVISIVANMSVLVFFKYATWAMESANAVFNQFSIPIHLSTAMAIPMLPGVSFYTFQTMSYTIDIYRREMKASRHLVNYLAFVSFWPHLVAGPIMRAKNLLQQIETIRPKVSPETARVAIMLIVYGIFKKVVLADNFGYLVEQIDNQAKGGHPWPGAGLLLAYAFAGQIYCDFSAYTTIARGSAKLINVELVRNFHTPYLSISPSDFWRRWHISLSTWLRDYVYIPMGGNRRGLYRNLMITMVLGGIWHGAGVLFIAWGIWHGFLLIVYRLIPIEESLMKIGKLGRGLSILITFHLVCFGWLLFRSDVHTFWPLLRSALDIGQISFAATSAFPYFAWAVLALGGIVAATDYLGYRKDSEFEDLFSKFNKTGVVALLVVCYFAIVLMGKREGAQFVYFQF